MYNFGGSKWCRVDRKYPWQSATKTKWNLLHWEVHEKMCQQIELMSTRQKAIVWLKFRILEFFGLRTFRKYRSTSIGTRHIVKTFPCNASFQCCVLLLFLVHDLPCLSCIPIIFEWLCALCVLIRALVMLWDATIVFLQSDLALIHETKRISCVVFIWNRFALLGGLIKTWKPTCGIWQSVFFILQSIVHRGRLAFFDIRLLQIQARTLYTPWQEEFTCRAAPIPLRANCC